MKPTGTGKKRAPEPPTDGWECVGVTDSHTADPLRVYEPRCDRCGKMLRFVHELRHDHWPTHLRTGCCCASRLCHDYDAAHAEREARNTSERLARFTDRKRWKRSNKNPANIWRRVRIAGHTLTVTVFLRCDEYLVFVAAGHDDNYCHNEPFPSQDQAMRAAFEMLEAAAH